MIHTLTYPLFTKDRLVVPTRSGPIPIPPPANLDLPPRPDPLCNRRLPA
ncbi:hypothetical protein ABMC89_02070 [Sulfitobacter sp. HNIBRBA3233]